MPARTKTDQPDWAMDAATTIRANHICAKMRGLEKPTREQDAEVIRAAHHADLRRREFPGEGGA